MGARAKEPGGSGAGGGAGHVVILGAGFAGLRAARTLRNKPVKVTLVDRNNYHKFQPLVYQVATAGLDAQDIIHPVRAIFRKDKNISFRLGAVQFVDPEKRHLIMHSGPPLPYDYLVFAPGASTTYFGVPGAERYSFPLKEVTEAMNLRGHILRQFETCEQDTSAADCGTLNFVIVGGGPTGVETAGQLMELFRRVLREDFRRVDPAKTRVILVEMLPELLMAFDQPLRAYSARELEKRGVEIRTKTKVQQVTPEAVHLDDGEVIQTRTVIWAAGVSANRIADTLKVEQRRGGRLVVDDDLRIPGHPEIFVVGDASGATDLRGEPYPQLATVAIQQGEHAAKQILRLIQGRPSQPFIFSDPGIMAIIGRAAAVVQLPRGLRLKGLLAWLIWALVHIAKLIGFRNRVAVLAGWAYNYLTYNFHTRVILDALVFSADREQEPENSARQRATPGPEKL